MDNNQEIPSQTNSIKIEYEQATLNPSVKVTFLSTPDDFIKSDIDKIAAICNGSSTPFSQESNGSTRIYQFSKNQDASEFIEKLQGML